MSCHPQTNPTNRHLNENCCWNGGGAHQGLRNAKISNKSSFGSIDTGSSCANDRMMVTVVTTCLIDFGAHECWYGLQTNSCLCEEGQSREIISCCCSCALTPSHSQDQVGEGVSNRNLQSFASMMASWQLVLLFYVLASHAVEREHASR